MNVPNALSIFRMILVPVFIAVFFSGIPHHYQIAVAIFILAGLTDIVDGKIARKYNQITMLGRILDPLADKLMVVSALICLTVEKVVPLWLVLVYAGKELVQCIGGLLLLKKIKDMPPSNKWGKASTAMFFLTIVVIILFENLPEEIKIGMLGACLALVFIALATYIVRAVRLTKPQP